MNTTPFATLLADPVARARDEFLERFGSAALVVEEVADKPPCDFDGRTPFVLPEWWRPTPAHLGGGRGALHPLHRYGNIVWLEKTRRNPFANLITVGRAPNNDIRFPLEALSKLHATLCQSATRWHIQDHGSRNGTFVNDEPLAPGRMRALEDGDQIRFCPELRTRFFTASALYDFVRLIDRMIPKDV